MLNFNLLPEAERLGWDLFTCAGYIPQFLSEASDLPAKEQIHRCYSHGGGWNPFSGFKKLEDGSIKYPGDPALAPLCEARLRDETITIYPHGWVIITQPDGLWEIARID